MFKLHCPHCGNTDPDTLRVSQWLRYFRPVRAGKLKGKPVLVVDELDSGSHYPEYDTLVCRECLQESEITVDVIEKHNAEDEDGQDWSNEEES
jgi:hypothetical protein